MRFVQRVLQTGKLCTTPSRHFSVKRASQPCTVFAARHGHCLRPFRAAQFENTSGRQLDIERTSPTAKILSRRVLSALWFGHPCQARWSQERTALTATAISSLPRKAGPNSRSAPVRLSDLRSSKIIDIDSSASTDTERAPSKRRRTKVDQPTRRDEVEPEQAKWRDWNAPDASGRRERKPFDLKAWRSKQDAEEQYERAKNSAAGSLLRRPHSSQELKQKLLRKEHSPEAAEQALSRLQEVGLQNDAEFAEVFARSKWRQSHWAPSRIRMELTRKGVCREDCDAALTAVFGSSDSSISVELDSEGDDSQFGQSTAPDQRLLETIQRRLDTMGSLSKEAKKRRLIGWMQRRGHSWSTVSEMLNAVGLSTN